MISDVLSDAVRKLDQYLNNESWDDCYRGEIRKRIIRCRNEMEMIRSVLDMPPSSHWLCNPHLLNEEQTSRKMRGLGFLISGTAGAAVAPAAAGLWGIA